MSTRSLHVSRPHAVMNRDFARRARVWKSQAHRSQADNIVRDRFRAKPLGWIKVLWKRLGTGRALGVAAEMAFWLFLSVLPLAAVAGLITAKFATKNWGAAASLLESFPTATQEMITNELGRVAAWNGGKVGISAGLVFVWLASSGIHSVFDGIELETEAKPRPWWKKRVLAIATCVMLSLGVAVLAFLGTGLGWLWEIVGGSGLFKALVIESSVAGKLLRLLVGAAVAMGLVSGLYWISVPPELRRSMPIVPGALMAIGLQTALGFGYGVYLDKTGDGGAYLAGLASIGVTLVALYLFCVALLIGVEVNQMLGERRRVLAGAR
jgi:membrane protein